jgi:hypothetical protein
MKNYLKNNHYHTTTHTHCAKTATNPAGGKEEEVDLGRHGKVRGG